MMLKFHMQYNSCLQLFTTYSPAPIFFMAILILQVLLPSGVPAKGFAIKTMLSPLNYVLGMHHFNKTLNCFCVDLKLVHFWYCTDFYCTDVMPFRILRYLVEAI